MRRPKVTTRSAFAIFTITLCEGLVPAWHDEHGLPVTYSTEREAQLEIVDELIEKLRQFIAGQRPLADVLTIEDFILPVEVFPDGTTQTEDGRRFGKH